MTDLNRYCVVGRITKDLDERSFGYTSSGSAFANVSIAVNRSVKKNEEWIDEVSFFDVNIWGKTAENLKPYLTKGTQIAVDGYLKQDRWEKDGQKFSRVVVVAEKINLVGGRKENGETNNSNFGKPVFQPSTQVEDTPGPEMINPEEIPF